jgi:hypothetical protein
MILMGSVLLIGAFQQYRQYRILIDAPKARVRSIPMGLVHLHGKAIGDEPLISPLTGARCFYFMTNIEEYVKTRTNKGTKWSWQTVAGDDDVKQFYLDDTTGRVLVVPLGAEQNNFDSQRIFYCEMGKDGHFKTVHPTPGIPAPTEQAVWAYIHGNHSRKLLEHVFEMEGERGRIMKSVMESSIKVMNAVQQVESLGTAPKIDSMSALQRSGIGGGPYRVSEECFLADSDCVVLGTCAENPNPKSSADRNIIRRGENEKTFLISTKGEKAIGKSLRNQGLTMFGLGAGLIVGAFAIALYAAGML